jgi:hypothetical protein
MNTDSQIAKRAYELWEKAGRPHGQDKQHWLQAEAEFQAGAANGARAGAVTTVGRAQPMLKTPKSRRAVGNA